MTYMYTYVNSFNDIYEDFSNIFEFRTQNKITPNRNFFVNIYNRTDLT